MIPVSVPPLRERREDVPLLVNHFLKKYAPAAGKSILRVNRNRWMPSAATSGRATSANWKTRSNALSPWRPGEELRVELPAERPKARAAAAGVGGPVFGSLPGSVLPEGVDMEKYVADIERSLLLAALAQSNGVQTRAADVLKISYRSFRHLVKKYDF